MADASPADESGIRQLAGTGELISAGSALFLLALMFGAKWFGIDELPGQARGVARETAENAWHALTILRWLMLLTIIVAVAPPLLHASQRSHGTTTATGGAVAGLGTVTALLLIYRVLINPPLPDQVVDQKLGAVLGVASALGIAFGGHASLRHERLRSRIGHRSRSQKSGVAQRPQAR